MPTVVMIKMQTMQDVKRSGDLFGRSSGKEEVKVQSEIGVHGTDGTARGNMLYGILEEPTE